MANLSFSALGERLSAVSDETILGVAFGSLLAGAVTAIGLDYVDLASRAPSVVPSTLVDSRTPEAVPGLAVPGRGLPRGVEPAVLKPMTFDLLADGRLAATGAIGPGTAKVFAEEIEKRGSYVKTVVLNSAGGSVQDALAMGRLIRARGFSTLVEDGGTCASSCPLVFAGGIERRAMPKAMIGVHQIFTAEDRSRPAPSAGETSDGIQRVSAACHRHMADMGIGLEVWLKAMETPKETLHVFKPDDLIATRLATAIGAAPKPVPSAMQQAPVTTGSVPAAAPAPAPAVPNGNPPRRS